MNAKTRKLLILFITLAIPITIGLLHIGSHVTVWTLAVIPALFMIIAFPSWKTTAALFVTLSAIKYITGYVQYDGNIPGDILFRLIINSCINWTVLFTIAYFRINYKKVTEKLAFSQQKYKSLFEYNPDAVYSIDPHGNMTSMNLALEGILGYSKEEFLNQSFQPVVAPEYLDMTVENFQCALHGEPREYETIGIHKNGNRIYLRVTNVPIVVNDQIVGVYGIAKDITKKKRIEQALRESEQRYRLITEHSLDMITVIDLEGIVLYASPSYETVLQIPPEEYVGKPFVAYVHVEDIPLLQERFDTAKTNKTADVAEFRYQHKDGAWIWVEAYGNPILDQDGNCMQLVVSARNISERKIYEDKLQYLAYHDSLTHLPNRRLFIELLEQAIKHAKRNHQQCAVMYMDIDGFKAVNDSLGHDIGDALLQQFAQRLTSHVREHDTVARLAGDEFTVLLPHIKDTRDVMLVAQRILHSFQEPLKAGPHKLHVTSSIGIAMYPTDADTGETLVKHADKALYAAKRSGKNNFQFFA